MTKPQARERIVVPIVRAEATSHWLFLQHKKSNLWFLPSEKIDGKPAILVATELIVKYIGDVENIQEFYTIQSDGKEIKLFVSSFDFEKTFALHKSISDQKWMNVVDAYNMPRSKIEDFTRTVIEITLETSKRMQDK